MIADMSSVYTSNTFHSNAVHDCEVAFVGPFRELRAGDAPHDLFGVVHGDDLVRVACQQSIGTAISSTAKPHGRPRIA